MFCKYKFVVKVLELLSSDMLGDDLDETSKIRSSLVASKLSFGGLMSLCFVSLNRPFLLYLLLGSV